MQNHILKVLTAGTLALALCAGISACAAYKRIDSVNNTFLEDVDASKKEVNLPFDHSWVSPRAKRSDYDNIYIKPIRLDRLPLNHWERSSSNVIDSEGAYMTEAAEIAKYFRKQLSDYIRGNEIKENIRGNQKSVFRLVDKVQANTIVMEIAFTELEFSHPVARALSLAAPVPGTGPVVASISDPHVAFAARFTDASTGRLLATVADRKFPPTRIIDFNKLTATSSVREVCSIWSKIIAEALDKGRFTKIEDESRFSLSAW